MEENELREGTLGHLSWVDWKGRYEQKLRELEEAAEIRKNLVSKYQILHRKEQETQGEKSALLEQLRKQEEEMGRMHRKTLDLENKILSLSGREQVQEVEK